MNENFSGEKWHFLMSPPFRSYEHMHNVLALRLNSLELQTMHFTAKSKTCHPANVAHLLAHHLHRSSSATYTTSKSTVVIFMGFSAELLTCMKLQSLPPKY